MRGRAGRRMLLVPALMLAACTGGGASPGDGGGGAGGSGADATSTATSGPGGPSGPSSSGSTSTGPGRECTFAILEDVAYDADEARFVGIVVPGFGGPEVDLATVAFPNRAHEVDLAEQRDPSAPDAVLLAEDVDPDLGVLGARFFQSEGELIVAADGWSLRDVRLVEIDADGALVDDGRCFDLGDVSGDVVQPFGWLCNPAYHDVADGCDCGCGLPDPDCALPDQELLNCFDGQSCSATGTCEGIPGAWTCDAAAWDDGATCDCGCGVPDVDCDEERPVTGCGAGDACLEGACVPPDEVGDCVDSIDDDLDGRIDCADADDCGGDAACTPGSTARDGACTAHADCATVAGDDPLCVGSVLGPAVSFCSEWCDLAVDDCGPGAFCLDVGSSRGVCLTTCDSDADDCAAGFACVEPDVGGDRFGCVTVTPPPPAEWVCGDGLYGTDDGCDCGCGVVDPDCADATAASCQFCGPDSCANDGTGDGCDAALLEPTDNATCSG